VTAISPELTASTSNAAPAVAAAVAPAANHGTSDLQAYDLYLRGRYFFEKRGEAGLRRALDYFQQAAEKDSMFARAYAGIANVYAILPLYANVRVDSLMPLALKAINRSVGLDSTLAEAFASRASLLQASWRWPEAERDYQRAVALDANYAAAHQWLGELLLLNGRTADGVAQLKRATELDPLSPITFGSYGLALATGRNPEAAITAGRRAVELDSTLLVARFMLGTVLLAGESLSRGNARARDGLSPRYDVHADDGAVGVLLCQNWKHKTRDGDREVARIERRSTERGGGRRGACVPCARRQRASTDTAGASRERSRLVLLERVACRGFLRSDSRRSALCGDCRESRIGQATPRQTVRSVGGLHRPQRSSYRIVYGMMCLRPLRQIGIVALLANACSPARAVLPDARGRA
jgi:tetratricopeptide (TPR) repeat protein